MSAVINHLPVHSLASHVQLWSSRESLAPSSSSAELQPQDFPSTSLKGHFDRNQTAFAVLLLRPASPKHPLGDGIALDSLVEWKMLCWPFHGWLSCDTAEKIPAAEIVLAPKVRLDLLHVLFVYCMSLSSQRNGQEWAKPSPGKELLLAQHQQARSDLSQKC